MAPFLWMGFNCFKPRAISRRQFTFYHQVPRYSWYSFYRPRKDERPSRPWSHAVVLNTGTLDLESSALTNRPLQTLSSRLVASNDHSYIVNTTYFESIEATSKHGKADQQKQTLNSLLSLLKSCFKGF